MFTDVEKLDVNKIGKEVFEILSLKRDTEFTLWNQLNGYKLKLLGFLRNILLFLIVALSCHVTDILNWLYSMWYLPIRSNNLDLISYFACQFTPPTRMKTCFAITSHIHVNLICIHVGFDSMLTSINMLLS